ncbi:MAG: hypothetical protein AB8H79_23060 [Myxococcota bacterium]
MLEQLKPLDLHAAARNLGVHPFEAVRLMVVSGVGSDRLRCTLDTLEQLRAFGQLEVWWTDAELPEDSNPRRAVVRGMVDALLQRQIIGEQTTRIDNLWRGLDAYQRDAAEQAVMVLHELGLLRSSSTAAGTRVSANPDGVEALRELVARGNAPSALAAVWED